MVLEAKICPSILASNFAVLGKEVERMEEYGADWIHVDVMDGHFVSNITLGPPVVKSIRTHSRSSFLDCHLMVAEPEKWIEAFRDAGASQITFHIETTDAPLALIKKIRDTGMKVGIALKPKTPVSEITAFIQMIDLVLIMTVEPGFGGQDLIPETLEKILEVRRISATIDIQVDGGVKLGNIASVVNKGANVIVSGSGIFQSADPKATIAEMREIVLSSEWF